ncbi:putative Sec7 domain-containing protein [Helianthus debilis subsp. tardiflorus]
MDLINQELLKKRQALSKETGGRKVFKRIQHNTQVKKKMTRDDFIRNNRRITGGNDLPREYLCNARPFCTFHL